MFADDATLYTSHSDFSSLVNLVNDEIVNLNRWSESNRLAINTERTNALLISNRPLYANFDNRIILNNNDLDYVDKVIFLGLTIDSKLKFKQHISVICTKLSKIVGILFRVSGFLSQRSLVNLYYSLFYPHLIYANLLWGGTHDTHLHIVELLQKKVVRIVTHSSYLAHTNDLFIKTGILKVKEIHEYLLLIYMFKNRLNFDISNSHYNTRHATDPVIDHHRLALTQHSVSFSSSKLYHSLPNELKSIPYLNSFKRQLKNFFLGKYRENQ